MAINQKGVALLLTLFILAFAFLLVAASAQLLTSEVQIMRNHYLRNKALYIAEAGVEYGIFYLRANNGNLSRTIKFPAGSGNSYRVTYTKNSGKITSVGKLVSGEQVTLEAKVLVKGERAPFAVKIIHWREL